MSLKKHKLKKAVLEKTLNKTEQGGGQREDNPKILPYYKLEFGEKIEVMFLAYPDGDLFKHFKKHGPNLGVGAVGSVDCIYHSRGDSCPACAKGYSYVEDGKGTPMSKKWMAKDYYVAQVVVVNAPFDIPDLEDKNEVRIFYMPFAVMEKIKESYAEGIVEDPTDHIFYIKKSKNQGGNASYANSYFSPKPAGEEIFDAFDDAIVELHDLQEEEIEPKLWLRSLKALLVVVGHVVVVLMTMINGEKMVILVAGLVSPSLILTMIKTTTVLMKGKKPKRKKRRKNLLVHPPVKAFVNACVASVRISNLKRGG